MFDVLSVDPVILGIVGQYHPESHVLVNPNVHVHVVPQNETMVTLGDGSSVTLPRYPCVLITNAYLGQNASEEPGAIILVDPEYYARGVWEGTDMRGPVQTGETLGDVVRLAKRIKDRLHENNWDTPAGTVISCLEVAPFQRVGTDKAGTHFVELGSHLSFGVSDPDDE